MSFSSEDGKTFCNCIKSIRKNALKCSFDEWLIEASDKIKQAAKHGYSSVNIFLPEHFLNFEKEDIEKQFKEFFLEDYFDYEITREYHFPGYNVEIKFKK